jgi:hypothetical protein
MADRWQAKLEAQMDITEAGKEQAIKLADEIYELINVDNFDGLSLGTIDEALSKLGTLSALYGKRDSEIEAAKSYLEKMKRPRADRRQLGQSLNYVAYGIRMSASNL